MPLQSFILGAGLGTRLAPLTHILPKPLMPVMQQPLIRHIMDEHYRAGVREFIVNTSCLELMWERAFPEPEHKGCPVHFSHEDEPLDSGGGLRHALRFIDRSQPLIVHNGDILTDIPVADLLAAHRSSGRLLTLALRSVDGNRNVGYDEASGLITDMRHALGVTPGTHQFAGTYIMEPALFDRFPQGVESFSVVPTWLELIREGQVSGVVFDWANWCELGTPEAYLDAVLNLPSGKRLHPAARISAAAELSEDCVVGQDAVVPAGCVLDDCVVWPRTHVEPGEYRRCILTPRIKVQV